MVPHSYTVAPQTVRFVKQGDSIPCKILVLFILIKMANTSAEIDSLQEPAPAPAEKIVDKSKIAVIFDLGNRAAQPSQLAVLIGGANKQPAPSTVYIPPMPEENSNGVIEIDQSKSIKLRYGTNLNISADRWKEIEKTPPASLGELYFQTNCFTVVKPVKATEASGYSCFSEKDAITLVLHTVNIADLESFGENETRGSVQLKIKEQREAIQDELERRRSAAV